jgi:hypothetical protein
MTTKMQTQSKISSVGLWWRWVLATLVGAAIGNLFGILACFAGFHYLSDRLIAMKVCVTGFGSLNCPVSTAIIAGALVVGAFVGLIQYFVLRQLIKAAGWWILASAFGWTWIGFASTSLAHTPQFGFVFDADGFFTESNILDRLPLLAMNSLWLVLAGLLLGILQTLVLYNGTHGKIPNFKILHPRFTKKRLLLWIAINIVLSTLLAVAVIAIFRGSARLYMILWFFLGFTPFYATITGATLVKMRLYHSIPTKTKIDSNLPLPTNPETSQLEN